MRIVYPTKFLNHTLPFRICKLCFQANMQVTSTLWPDIKSKNYQSTDLGSDGPKVMQKPNSNKSRQANPNVDQTRRPKTACQKKLGRLVARAGRPTYLVGRPSLWAPLPQPGNVALPLWSPTSVVLASPHGYLL